MLPTIQPLTHDQLEAAKAVITEVCFEFFGQAPLAFDDMEDATSHYSEPSGTFLLLVDDGEVVGTGGIRRLDEETCELKRMWFLPAYRGKGFGTKMSELLLEFARSAGYKRVRLDSAPELYAATRLYRRLGFTATERYNDGPCTMFLEKQL